MTFFERNGKLWQLFWKDVKKTIARAWRYAVVSILFGTLLMAVFDISSEKAGLVSMIIYWIFVIVKPKFLDK